ncbi:MAG: aldo/keto reductase [Chloroflexi bacterium]|nr:aldo/keto reductase [Chloroflexota bacterium]
MTIHGSATQSGTAVFMNRHPSVQFSSFGNLPWSVSSVGFGGYRVDNSQDSHQQAVRLALQNGINLIDTSSNYADGGSETLFGNLLTELITSQVLTRKEVVVISKAGYVQGQNYALARKRKEEGRPFPNLVKVRADMDHCIHPEFLHDQLTRSLQRLNLETIDGYLLHNPEYYLSWAHVANISLHEARTEYYRRIKLAFEYLETEVERGRIQWYGISSNTLPISSKDATFTSIERLWKIASTISTNHHFGIVQFPLNLYETGAVTEQNLSDQQSTIQYANEKGLAVLINRPLNAIWEDSIKRLVDVLPPSYPTTPQEVSTAVDTSLKAEEAFQSELLPLLKIDEETQQQLLQYLAVGLMLQGRWASFGSYHSWQDLQNQFLLPRAQSAVQFLSNLENLPAKAETWLHSYTEAVNDTVGAVGAFYQEISHKESSGTQATVNMIDPDWRAETLSQTAVRALRSTTGISSVLVGMRHEQYVQDILSDLHNPVKQQPREAAWQAVKTRLTT